MKDIFTSISIELSSPVECLGFTFPNDRARREHFLAILREKLKDPAFRKIEGFPIGSDEDILAMSDPPYYTACPNPFLEEFVRRYGKPYDPNASYSKEPFVADVSEGKNDPIYNTHSYPTKVPHKAIMRYIDYYTEAGDLILDGFCGTGMSGVATTFLGEDRNCLLIDLSPIATFIAKNLNGLLDPIAFYEAAKKIAADILLKNNNFYTTNHNGWRVKERKKVVHKHYKYASAIKGDIEFVLYSDVVACPNCAAQHSFYSIAVDELEDQLSSEFQCPTCGKTTCGIDWELCFETRIDPILNLPHKQAKVIPVLINYSVGKSRFEKLPDEEDLLTIALTEHSISQINFPTVKLIPGKETQRNAIRGVTYLHHFFTPRELYCVALLLKEIKAISKTSIRHSLLFALTACLPYASKMRRFRADRKGGGPLSGTLYIGSLTTPPNVLKSFLRNAKTIASSLFYQNTVGRKSIISTQSSTSLSNIPSESTDYIFIDPPFGSNFDYSELNYFWEAMLGVVTCQNPEVIVSASQQKQLDEYRFLLTRCFKEFFRILKPSRWMTVEFSNTQASVWNAIQTSLQESGFIVANVSALDKQQGSFKAVTTATAVKQDLVISAYKPNGGLEERFAKFGGSQDSVWDFVRTHLGYLPVVKTKSDGLEFITERDPRILYDRLVAWFVRHNTLVPISSQEFQTELRQRFAERDGMIFLLEQVAEYDKKRMQVAVAPQIEIFISDERSAIDWLTVFLKKKPSTYAEIHPEYIPLVGAAKKKGEIIPELAQLLEDNFLQYDGKGDVPSQIHSYLSTNHKDQRGLEKNDPGLIAKAKDRWYAPDPNKAQDLEKKRDKALLREFERYRDFTGRRLREFRLEALRAGFKHAWANKDYAAIIAIARKMPEDALQEDEKLLLWYDQALTRTELGA